MCFRALIAFIGLVAPAAAQESAAPESLFPLAVGNKWTYKVSGQEDRFVVRVAGRETVGSHSCFKVEGWLRDKVVATEYVAFTRAGLCRFRVEHEDVAPPLCIVKVAAPNGARWEAKYALGTRGATGTFQAAAAPAELTVPFGTFKAVKVEAWTGDPRKVPPRSTVWYAPGVGPVKQTILDGKSTFDLELESFEKGK